MTDLPAPLTPPDCDLSDFQYMELDVRRLRDSKFAASGDAEGFRAGVLLWCAAWHQIPAASLPDDDEELANLSGYGRVVKEWKKVRAQALRGFVKCSDGRLYHSVIAEKALSAHEAKRRHAFDKLCERLRKENKKRGDQKQLLLGIPTYEQWKSGEYMDGIPAEKNDFPAESANPSSGTPPETGPPVSGILNSNGDSSAGIPLENALKGNRTEQNGTERERNGEGDFLEYPGGVPPDPPAPTVLSAGLPRKRGTASAAAPSSATWEAYAEAYRQRYGADPVRNRKVNSQLLQLVERLGADAAPEVAKSYLLNRNGLYVASKHCTDLLLRDAEKLHTEWVTGNVIHQRDASEEDRLSATGAMWGRVGEKLTAKGIT